MWYSISHKWNIIWLSKGWWPNKYYVVKKNLESIMFSATSQKAIYYKILLIWDALETSRLQFPEHPREREGTAAQQAWCFLLQWQIKGSDVCVAQCICGEPSNSTYTWKWWVSCHVIVVRWRMAHYFFSLEAWKSLLISSLTNSFQHMTNSSADYQFKIYFKMPCSVHPP